MGGARTRPRSHQRRRVVVDPDSRGMGLGGRLVDAIKSDADRYGDFSFGECRTAHAGSQILFERAGFTAVLQAAIGACARRTM